jgi:uncharacterized protein (DUF2141 family)
MLTDEHAVARINRIGCGLILGLALLAASACAVDLHVAVHGVARPHGKVMIALFDRPTGFPNTMVQGLALDAVPPTVTGVFTALQPGEFAVAVYHDENGNGTLDKNLFGMLTEPYGFGLNPTRMSPGVIRDDGALRLEK